MITSNEKERISAELQKDESRIYAARKLSRWFSIYFRIQMFGQTIIEKEWPSGLFDEEKEVSNGNL